MKINDFVLVGLSEAENYVEKNDEIPQEWNQSQESWSFRYKHAKSPNTYVLKILKLGSKLLVHVMAIENEKEVCNLEVTASNYINSEIKNIENNSAIDVLKNLGELIDNFNENISSKILKDVNFKKNIIKEKANFEANKQNRDSYGYDPLRVESSGRYRDPLLIGRGGVGHDDLYGVGGGFGYLPGFGGPGGGNVVGPNHPMFNPGGPRGGIVYPGSHPSGARYDPYGPVGPGFGGGGPHNPKPDHFRPPDWGDDMFG
jgi:proteasome inhibitor subunit 1 (PI31)